MFCYFVDDEDWTGDAAESTLYLINESHQMSFPRPSKISDTNSENALKDKTLDSKQKFSRLVLFT